MNKKNKARRAGALSRAKANDQRKRNEKARREGDETLAKLNAALQTALTLFEGDDADAVIDEPGPGYQEIIQGMEAEGNLLAGYVYGNGLRRKQANAQMLASGLVVRLQLVHFAYAAGVRLGEERAAKEYNASLTKIIKGQAELGAESARAETLLNDVLDAQDRISGELAN